MTKSAEKKSNYMDNHRIDDKKICRPTTNIV